MKLPRTVACVGYWFLLMSSQYLFRSLLSESHTFSIAQ